MNEANVTDFYDAKPWQAFYSDKSPKTHTPLPHRNMAELIDESSGKFAHNTAFSLCLPNGMSASINYQQVHQQAENFALYLRHQLGLDEGDRVAIQMPNCLAYPMATFGILKAGCIGVNVNPLYTAHEMIHQLNDSGAKVLVIIDMFADKLEEVKANVPSLEKILIVSVADFFPWLKGTIIKVVQRLKKQIPAVSVAADKFTKALELGAANSGKGKIDLSNIDRDTTAILQYTGGTTGVSKGAELTHGNLLSNLKQIEEMARPVLDGSNEVVLTALPLYHIFAFTFNMMVFYYIGGHNVLIPSPRPVSNLQKPFELFPITKFSGVNILFQNLALEPWFKENPPAKLNLSLAGGAALQEAVGKHWEEASKSPILQGYGLTETSPVVCVNPPDGKKNKHTSAGVGLNETQFRIVDGDGNVMPQGEEGEIIIKGPQIMKGYWNRPDETAKALKDGWFYTGDIGRMDEDGFLFIVDRKKDMIDVNGFNVFPNEVEDALAAFEGVVEVAVIGVPDGKGSETVKAYIVSNKPSMTAEEVIEFARTRLTAYKVPKQIEFRDELPKSPVGKILRKDLRAEEVKS